MRQRDSYFWVKLSLPLPSSLLKVPNIAMVTSLLFIALIMSTLKRSNTVVVE